MGSPSLLHVHATAWSTGGEQTLERAKEEIRVEDEVMEEVTHTQSQPQPESLSPLLSVSNGSGPEPIPRPVSAPPVFPHSGLESDRRDVEEEAAVGSANDHGDYRARYVLFYSPYCPNGHIVQFARVAPFRHEILTLNPSYYIIYHWPCSSIAGLHRLFQRSYSALTRVWL